MFTSLLMKKWNLIKTYFQCWFDLFLSFFYFFSLFFQQPHFGMEPENTVACILNWDRVELKKYQCLLGYVKFQPDRPCVFRPFCFIIVSFSWCCSENRIKKFCKEFILQIQIKGWNKKEKKKRYWFYNRQSHFKRRFLLSLIEDVQ